MVAGVGGSGTRVVAAMLQRLGFFLGDDLNRSLDNLWFTLLFRRPRWWTRGGGRRSFDRNLRVFLSCMQGEFAWTPATTIALTGAYRDMVTEYNRAWVLERIASMRNAKGPHTQAAGWGWKEPNSHVMLTELIDRLPQMRYIHVIRHGLDMAFSDNQHQLRRWGAAYGIPTEGLTPEERSARYWLAANRRALDLGRSRLRGRFHVVDFNRMCRDPASETSRLLGFLGFPGELAKELARMVEPPSSLGRHRDSVDRFTPSTTEAVEALMSALAED